MPAGKPPLYKTAEELQNKVDEYFEKGVAVKKITVGKEPNKTILEVQVPTITGLCAYLGFADRQSFYDYEKHERYSCTIKKARLRIETSYEEQLQHGNTVGAIFALKNLGWKDEKSTKHEGNLTVTHELSPNAQQTVETIYNAQIEE